MTGDGILLRRLPRRAVMNLAGVRFGRLVGLRFDGHIGRDRTWMCQCDCGNTKRIRVHALRSGNTRSCGCLEAENRKTKARTHGHALVTGKSPTYWSWLAMRNRCTNPRAARYERYGGRGITVCDRWLHSFENFLADMGQRPAGMTLDRHPNPDGNYEPGNVRWATAKQQAPSGRRNGASKLTEDDVRSIRALAETGLTHEEIAARFSVARRHVGRILSRERRSQL